VQRRFRWSALAAFLLVIAGPLTAQAQNYADGYAAFNAGNYQSARAIWQDLADRGDTLAMIGLGTLYERGFGVPQSLPRALQLYRQAQALGDPRAAAYVQRVRAVQPAQPGPSTPRISQDDRGSGGDPVRRSGQSGLQAVRGPYAAITVGPSFAEDDGGGFSDSDTGIALDAMGGWDFGMVRLQGGLIYRRSRFRLSPALAARAARRKWSRVRRTPTRT